MYRADELSFPSVTYSFPFRCTYTLDRRQQTGHIMLRPMPSAQIAYAAAAVAATDASLPPIVTHHLTVIFQFHDFNSVPIPILSL